MVRPTELLTAVIGAAMVGSLILRPNTANVIDAMNRGSVNMMAVALGGQPVRQKLQRVPTCDREIYWPTVDGTWTVFYCPLDYGHKGQHINQDIRYPFWEEDIQFMERQYRLYCECS